MTYEAAIDLVPEYLWCQVYYAKPQTVAEVQEFLKHELLSGTDLTFAERAEIRKAIQALSTWTHNQSKV